MDTETKHTQIMKDYLVLEGSALLGTALWHSKIKQSLRYWHPILGPLV